MTVFIATLVMQLVVSVKAGLVNHVQGTANVAEMETARVNRPIRTGSDGYVEVLLRPGSFLRLGENSEAVIDDADIAQVKLTATVQGVKAILKGARAGLVRDDDSESQL